MKLIFGRIAQWQGHLLDCSRRRSKIPGKGRSTLSESISAKGILAIALAFPRNLHGQRLYPRSGFEGKRQTQSTHRELQRQWCRAYSRAIAHCLEFQAFVVNRSKSPGFHADGGTPKPDTLASIFFFIFLMNFWFLIMMAPSIPIISRIAIPYTTTAERRLGLGSVLKCHVNQSTLTNFSPGELNFPSTATIFIFQSRTKSASPSQLSKSVTRHFCNL